MKEIAIFTLVIWCIGVESLPGAREKRETTGETTGETTDCSFLYTDELNAIEKWHHAVFLEWPIGWQESRVHCQNMGGDLAEPSTPEKQDKMLAAIDKFPTGKSSSYWIGIKAAFWVSGAKLELDSIRALNSQITPSGLTRVTRISAAPS